MSRASGGQAVRVVIRTRPTASFAQEHIIVGEDRQQLTVRMPKGDNPNAQDNWSWRYDSVLHNASQETAYMEQVYPIVQSVLQGYNGTVMCYGQTGAGKTFTQIGSLESFQNRGVTPRAVADIFGYINDHPQFEATVAVSYVEIYQDTLIDLLSTLPTAEPITEPLQLVEDKHGSTSVKNLRVQPVASEEDALALLFEGQTNRQIANHQLNRSSTRGHAIFTIHVKMRSRVDSSGVVTRCKLNLVDLAGSERLKKTDTVGDLRSESMYINKSLTYLEQVVVALASKGRSHTPYRQSKLTHLLKDSLGGNCKTLLIANVYGEQHHLEETISTLQFAARVRLVPNEASLNVEHDPEQLLKKYAIEIADLKRELAMHDSLASRSRVAYEPYSDQQRLALMEELQAFLNAKEGEGDAGSDINIESVRQMRELLSAMKTLYGKQADELAKYQALLANGGSLPGGVGGLAGAPGSANPFDPKMAEGDGVGDATDPKRGIAVGHAPDGAAPNGGLVEPPAYQREGAGGDEGDGDGLAMQKSSVGPQDGGMGRDEAYAAFKKAEGAAINDRLLVAKKTAKSARLKRSELAAQVNAAKSTIDRIKDSLAAKKAERALQGAAGGAEDTEIIDEEEYAFIQEMRAAKKQYKDSHEAMVAAGEQAASAASEVDAARQELLTQFNEWYAIAFHEQAEPLLQPSVREPPPAADKDVMDDDEQFEQLQMARVMADEPESLAFVRARKAVNKRGGGNARRK